MKKRKFRPTDHEKVHDHDKYRNLTAEIPMSYTEISFKNFLSAKPPNTTTFDFPTLTAVWPLRPRTRSEILAQPEINREKKNDRGWECEAINHLRASGGLPPKSEASALTQCIILSLSLFLDFDGTLSNSDLAYTVTTRSALLSGESRRLPKDVALFLKF